QQPTFPGRVRLRGGEQARTWHRQRNNPSRSGRKSSRGGCTSSSKPAIRCHSPRRSRTLKPTFIARWSSCSPAARTRRPQRSCSSNSSRPTSIGLMKVEAMEVEGRKVYSVRAFNLGVATYLQKLPTVWVEGEVTELRRQQRWATVYFTLKDPDSGACLSTQMPRGQFDALRLDLVEGERVHVYGRPELYEQRGDFHLRALTIERFGLGAHLAALERLKRKLAAEGLFAASRKRPLPRIPALIGLVTGNDAAAKRDVLTAITTRFPPAHVLVAETYVQRPRAAPAPTRASVGAPGAWSSATAGDSRSRTSGSGARRCSRSSAARHASRTPTPACGRSRRARRSSAATRSSAPATSSSGNRPPRAHH